MGGFANNAPIVTDGLVFYVDAGNSKSYDGVSGGTTWTDLVGGNNGTLTNMETNPANAGYVYDSLNGGSIAFDGTNEYVDCGANNLFSGNTSFSLSGWLNVKTHSSYGLALYIGNAALKQSAWIGWCDVAQTGTAQTIGGGLYGSNLGSGVEENTGWHNVTLTYDTSSLKLYIDGSFTNSRSDSGANISSSSIRLGRSNTGTTYDYNGDSSSFLIYNKELSAAEVLQNYNALKNRFV